MRCRPLFPVFHARVLTCACGSGVIQAFDGGGYKASGPAGPMVKSESGHQEAQAGPGGPIKGEGAPNGDGGAVKVEGSAGEAAAAGGFQAAGMAAMFSMQSSGFAAEDDDYDED